MTRRSNKAELEELKKEYKLLENKFNFLADEYLELKQQNETLINAPELEPFKKFLSEELQLGFAKIAKDQIDLLRGAVQALKLAESWLDGWASAEHELAVIRSAIEKCGGQNG